MRISGTICVTIRSLTGKDEQEVTRPLNQMHREENWQPLELSHDRSQAIRWPGLVVRLTLSDYPWGLVSGTTTMSLLRLFALSSIVFAPVVLAQTAPADPPVHKWHASWVTHPTAPLRDPIVLHFR